MADEATGGANIPQYFEIELMQAAPAQKEVPMKFKFISGDDKEGAEVVQFTLDLAKVRISHIN